MNRTLLWGTASVLSSIVLTTSILCQTNESTKQTLSVGSTLPDITQIAKNALSAVVSISVYDSSGRELKTGSGFIVSDDGKVVTNYHVIKGGHSAKLTLNNGASFDVVGVLGISPEDDLAVLKVQGSELPVLRMGDSEHLRIGERVICIGSPLGLGNSVSDGLVSAIRNEGGKQFVQTTAPASPGNSGGPLLTLSGDVVGVLTFKLVGGENLNFAVPINVVRPLLSASGTLSALDKLGSSSSAFHFAPGQSVYVVASSLDLERKAREEFQKLKRYKTVSALKDADFVFVVIQDATASRPEELALVTSPSDYKQWHDSLDALRNSAQWQSQDRFHAGKTAAVALPTLGYGALFYHPSVVKGLVEKFHKEIH